MRNAMIPFVLLATTGCGIFGGGDSTMESYYTDCIEKYETAKDEIGDADDLEEFSKDLRDWSNGWEVKKATAGAEISVKLEEMEEGDREGYVEELAEKLKDLQDDCAEAKKDFMEEVMDDEDLMKDFMEVGEDYGETFEDCQEAAEKEFDGDMGVPSFLGSCR